MQGYIVAILVAVGVLAGIAAGGVIGYLYRRNVGEKAIGSAEQEAKRLIDEALKEGDTKRKEAQLEAKEEVLALRNEAEQEIKERRLEIARSERRIAQKEETLEKKTEAMEKKSEQLDRKIREVEVARGEVDEVLAKHQQTLEQLSGITAEEAKEELISRVESEVKHELAQRMQEMEDQFREEADSRAKNIIALAIQRYAADNVAEATISTVSLPSEEMKGRIIGREGRNIQKIETLTGVELIIDDTPEVITLSGFDPVRREVARLALEKLIADGRIHPARIEEMVEKAKREVDTEIKQAGENATFEVSIHDLSPELVRLLGKLRYRTSYGQNVLRHSVEVAFLAGMMAEELGLDRTLAKRAGLLHDIGKAFPHDSEGSHVEIGVAVLKKNKENREVIHAVEAHHGDVEPKTIIAVLVQAADAISAARPGARREDLENYIKRLEKLEELAKSFNGVEKAYAIQAGREIRVMVKPEQVSDSDMVLIARDMANKIKEEVKYPGQIKINVIRESRATSYAK